jgi:tetratricopeptide (TPR) repeat protein
VEQLAEDCDYAGLLQYPGVVQQELDSTPPAEDGEFEYETMFPRIHWEIAVACLQTTRTDLHELAQQEIRHAVVATAPDMLACHRQLLRVLDAIEERVGDQAGSDPVYEGLELERVISYLHSECRTSTEISGLAGRYWRTRWRSSGQRRHWTNALEAYRYAAEESPEEYYNTVNVAALYLLNGDEAEAETWYQRVIERCESVAGSDYWACFSMGEAHFVLGNAEEGIAYYERALSPSGASTARDVESARKGLCRIEDRCPEDCRNAIVEIMNLFDQMLSQLDT